MTPSSSSSRRAAVVRRRRPGLALATVLFFLTVVALLATGAVFSVRQTTRAGDLALADARLVAAGDAALYGALERWDAVHRAEQGIGTTEPLDVGSGPAERGVVALHVTRLTSATYVVVAEVATRGDDAGRGVQLLVRAAPPRRDAAAIVAAGDVVLAPDVTVTPAAAGPCLTSDSAAVRLAPGARVALTDSSAAAPPVTTVVDTDAADIGGWLARARIPIDPARADIALGPDARVAPAPASAGGVCLATDANWGDPDGGTPACAGRFPVIHASGDLAVEGGAGQGLLVVDGRLRITAPFHFAGVIVAYRGVEITAPGVAIDGTIHAGAFVPDATPRTAVVLAPGSVVRAESCDARHWFTSLIRARMVRPRAWSEVF